MREILFRGMRLDNCNWIIGHLIKYEDGRARICESHTDIFCYEKDESILQTVAHMVAPSTIGQFTGLTDKNGKMIFEGDIVQCKDRLEKHLEVFGFIDHKNGSFVITGDFMTHYRWLDYEVEVIGNIHDNHELFENP